MTEAARSCNGLATYFTYYTGEAWTKRDFSAQIRIPRRSYPVHTQKILTQKEISEGVPGFPLSHLLLAFVFPTCSSRCLCWTVVGLWMEVF